MTLRSGGDGSARQETYHRSPQVLGGYYLLDVADLDKAVRLAQLLPELASEYPAGVEIREIPAPGGEG